MSRRKIFIKDKFTAMTYKAFVNLFTDACRNNVYEGLEEDKAQIIFSESKFYYNVDLTFGYVPFADFGSGTTTRVQTLSKVEFSLMEMFSEKEVNRFTLTFTQEKDGKLQFRNDIDVVLITKTFVYGGPATKPAMNIIENFGVVPKPALFRKDEVSTLHALIQSATMVELTPNNMCKDFQRPTKQPFFSLVEGSANDFGLKILSYSHFNPATNSQHNMTRWIKVLTDSKEDFPALQCYSGAFYYTVDWEAPLIDGAVYCIPMKLISDKFTRDFLNDLHLFVQVYLV